MTRRQQLEKQLQELKDEIKPLIITIGKTDSLSDEHKLAHYKLCMQETRAYNIIIEIIKAEIEEESNAEIFIPKLPQLEGKLKTIECGRCNASSYVALKFDYCPDCGRKRDAVLAEDSINGGSWL